MQTDFGRPSKRWRLEACTLQPDWIHSHLWPTNYKTMDMLLTVTHPQFSQLQNGNSTYLIGLL